MLFEDTLSTQRLVIAGALERSGDHRERRKLEA